MPTVLGGLMSEVDKRALTGEFVDTLAESFRRAVSAGEHIPTARVHLHPNEGHLSLGVAALDRIVADLAAGQLGEPNEPSIPLTAAPDTPYSPGSAYRL